MQLTTRFKVDGTSLYRRPHIEGYCSSDSTHTLERPLPESVDGRLSLLIRLPFDPISSP